MNLLTGIAIAVGVVVVLVIVAAVVFFAAMANGQMFP
jgi:nitrogen fixation-related uncharacterized protein